MGGSPRCNLQRKMEESNDTKVSWAYVDGV